jgi:hypothetical protein
MIKTYKMFEKASKDLAPYQKLKPKQADAFVKILAKDLNWDKMDAADLADLEKKTGMKAGEIINMHFAINQDPGAIAAFKSSYAKANGAKDWGMAIRAVKESDRFKSDEDIAAEFANFTVEEFKMPGSFTNKMMGNIILSFPEADESVGGGSSQTVEDFLYNDATGEFKLAFDNWYPEEVAMQILDEVKKRISEAANKPVKQIKFGQDWTGEDNPKWTQK